MGWGHVSRTRRERCDISIVVGALVFAASGAFAQAPAAATGDLPVRREELTAPDFVAIHG
jgi:hypothetical protein